MGLGLGSGDLANFTQLRRARMFQTTVCSTIGEVLKPFVAFAREGGEQTQPALPFEDPCNHRPVYGNLDQPCTDVSQGPPTPKVS